MIFWSFNARHKQLDDELVKSHLPIFSCPFKKIERKRYMKEYIFRIKNKRWTIKVAKSGSEYLIKDNMVCIAQLYKQLRTIYIDEGLLNDEVELRETIIHELVHAFIMTYAIDHKEFRDEEFICEFIAVYGDDILKTANELMAYFYEE